VDIRQRQGDWEVDAIIGKGHPHAIVSLTEWKIRLALLKEGRAKNLSRRSRCCDRAPENAAGPNPYITADNSKEFADHERIARDLRTKVYFAHPYSSWERATNENMNGLIRQYFPKKHNFVTITENEIEFVMERLNNRPR
jgi:IS30 family transposase